MKSEAAPIPESYTDLASLDSYTMWNAATGQAIIKVADSEDLYVVGATFAWPWINDPLGSGGSVDTVIRDLYDPIKNITNFGGNAQLDDNNEHFIITYFDADDEYEVMDGSSLLLTHDEDTDQALFKIKEVEPTTAKTVKRQRWRFKRATVGGVEALLHAAHAVADLEDLFNKIRTKRTK